MTDTIDSPSLPDGFPARITLSLPKAGRDPLGLQTITEDRITPILLPGVLALSRRARYFSYYPFLLDLETCLRAVVSGGYCEEVSKHERRVQMTFTAGTTISSSHIVEGQKPGVTCYEPYADIQP